MFGKHFSHLFQLLLLEGPIELHVAKVFSCSVVTVKFLFVLVQCFVDVEVEQVLLAIDVSCGVNHNFLPVVPHRFYLSLVGTRLVSRPNLSGAKRQAILLKVWIKVLVSLRQHTLGLVAERVFVGLQVAHEPHVRFVLLVLIAMKLRHQLIFS